MNYNFKNNSEQINFESGTYIIVGRNGVGKTTLLHSIKDQCKKQKIPVYHYDNYTEGGTMQLSWDLEIGDTESFKAAAFASEGERIFHNLGKIMQKIGSFIRTNGENENGIVIMLDAFDSGLDIDGLRQLQYVCNIIHNDCPKALILITANNYALVKGMNCYDVRENKFIQFSSYEEYEEFILKQYKFK